MTKITESAIETFAIELLEKLGYQYIYAPDIAPNSETPERERFEDVLLLERLRAAVARINPSIPFDVREEAITGKRPPRSFIGQPFPIGRTQGSPLWCRAMGDFMEETQ